MYLIFHQPIQAIFHIFFLADIFGYLQEKSCKILTESVAVSQRLGSNHGLEWWWQKRI
ncbi:MAG: hypothetical protein K940chlam2_01793 [Chlamydiae bacterium]|nr:hypothetical protein [Chlamydiota bacterium]